MVLYLNHGSRKRPFIPKSSERFYYDSLILPRAFFICNFLHRLYLSDFVALSVCDSRFSVQARIDCTFGYGTKSIDGSRHVWGFTKVRMHSN